MGRVWGEETAQSGARDQTERQVRNTDHNEHGETKVLVRLDVFHRRVRRAPIANGRAQHRLCDRTVARVDRGRVGHAVGRRRVKKYYLSACFFIFFLVAVMEEQEEEGKNATNVQIETVAARLSGNDKLRLGKLVCGGPDDKTLELDTSQLVTRDGAPTMTWIGTPPKEGWSLIRSDLLFDKFTLNELTFDVRHIFVSCEVIKAIAVVGAFNECGMCHRRFVVNAPEMCDVNMCEYYPLDTTLCQECFRRRVPPLVAGATRDSKREAEESFDACKGE